MLFCIAVTIISFRGPHHCNYIYRLKTDKLNRIKITEKTKHNCNVKNDNCLPCLLN